MGNNNYINIILIPQLAKTSEDEAMMKEEQTRLQSEIDAWEKKFQKKNGREPTEDEKYSRVDFYHEFLLVHGVKKIIYSYHITKFDDKDTKNCFTHLD